MYKYRTKTYSLVDKVIICTSDGLITSNAPIKSFESIGGLFTIVKGKEGNRIVF